MRAEMDSMRQGQDRTQAQMAALQAELDEACVRADRAEADLERVSAETEVMRTELKEKDDAIDSLTAKLEAARAELKAAQSQQSATPFRQYDGSFYPRTEGAMSYYPMSIADDRSVLSGFSPQSPKSNKPRGQLTPMDKKWEGAMLRTSLFMSSKSKSTPKESIGDRTRRELAF